MRQLIPLIVGLALVLAGCVSHDRSQQETTTPSAEVIAPSITVTNAPYGSVDGQERGSAVESTDTTWVRREWSPPTNMIPFNAVWGDRGMVVLGYTEQHPDDSPTPNGLWFFDGDAWSGAMLGEVTIPDEYGFTPVVTDLVWFGGRYLAFLMGDATTTPGRASMLASTDGIDWELEYLGAPPSAALPAGLYATPESPPWPGTSAITKACIHGTEITVVGWTVLGSGESRPSVPVVWRSTDGRTWSTKALPNANFDNEWASDVAVGPLGYLVEVAGPVHQSAYLWYSPDGDDWTYVGDRFDDQWRGLVAAAVGEKCLLAILMDLEDDGGPTLNVWRSTNGLDWEEVETPFPLGISPDEDVFADLVNTRNGIVTIVVGETATDLWRTSEGVTWTRLPSIDLPRMGRPVGIVPVRPVPASSGEHLVLTAVVPDAVVRWTEATEARSVVHVASDDVLNVRSGPGIEHEIVATLSPTTTGVKLTGRQERVGSSTWLEIVTDQRTGWVNGHYLAEQD